MPVLNEVVDKNRLWKARNEHFWYWFYKTFGIDLRVQMYRDLFVSLYKLTGKKYYCGNHGCMEKEIKKWLSTVISIIENTPDLPDRKRKYVMDKKYTIAVAGTGARDIIGSTKKTYDN